ncbi:MAG: hypothetical protein KDI13_08230 [Alphaproteobacteria bacterium]|nr:hypothetical protein [Alphaproteobacteria bacterium]
MIKVNFTNKDKKIIYHCIVETGGYAGSFIKSFLGNTNEEELRTIFLDSNASVNLEKEQWLDIYNLMNAVIYELGQEELHTITGYDLPEMATVVRKIFTAIHSRYYGDDFE